jgi:hypothetical protein
MTQDLDYTIIMRDRIVEIQKLRHISHKQAAATLGMSVNTYSDWKRVIKDTEEGKEVRKPKRHKISTSLLADMCDLFDCTVDYIQGSSDVPDQNSKGQRKINPFVFQGKSEFYKIHDKLDKLSYNDKVLLTDFFLYTPESTRKKVLKGIKATLQAITEDSVSVYINRSLHKGQYIDLANGIASESFIETLIITQDAEKHVSKKRYRDALRTYCEAIKCRITSDNYLYGPNDLFYVCLGHIRALQKNWPGFPKELDIVKLLTKKAPENFTQEDISRLDEIITKLRRKNKNLTSPKIE